MAGVVVGDLVATVACAVAMKKPIHRSYRCQTVAMKNPFTVATVARRWA